MAKPVKSEPSAPLLIQPSAKANGAAGPQVADVARPEPSTAEVAYREALSEIVLQHENFQKTMRQAAAICEANTEAVIRRLNERLRAKPVEGPRK